MQQYLTSGEFQNQFKIFISSCKTCSETSFQTMTYATTGLFFLDPGLRQDMIRLKLTAIPRTRCIIQAPTTQKNSH